MSTEPGLGDIGLVPIPGDVGWLISLGERLNGDAFAHYDHAFVVTGSNQIVEAEPGGARFAALSEYDPESVLWLRCPDGRRQAVAEAAKGLLNSPYSAADYFAIALHRFHVPAPGLRRYIQSSGHLICSALCDRAARDGGWTLFSDGRWEGYVTPADLAELAAKQAE